MREREMTDPVAGNGGALHRTFFCGRTKRRSRFAIYSRERERADKHYLNWAISPDDYVRGFANCTAIAPRSTRAVKRVATR